jgi:phospholipase C
MVMSPISASGASFDMNNIRHVVIIYQENHSFDSRYGGWEGVNGINGTYVPQVDQQGQPYQCLPQNQPDLASPPLHTACIDATHGIKSAFPNQSFLIDPYWPKCAGQLDCRFPSAGLTHTFYENRYQIHDGKNDRFVVASRRMGLAVYYSDTSTLPLYKYLHEGLQNVRYVILDNFFMGAFGGSFLNHQWLIAATTPKWPHARNDGQLHDHHSVVDENGMSISGGKAAPLYKTPARYPLVYDDLTVSCNPPSSRGPTPAIFLADGTCGDFVINTIQPNQQPFKSGALAEDRLPLLDNPTIGDRMTEAGVDWAWYSQGWSNANGDVGAPGWTGKWCTEREKIHCPHFRFQFHHQPFNYYKAFDQKTDAGKKNRIAHLRDSAEFRNLIDQSAATCQIKKVNFYKFLLTSTEHSQAGPDHIGNQQLTDLVRKIESSACAPDTMIIIAYDENGGEYDHVAPPSALNMKGPYDAWGPGSRVGAFIISPLLPVDAGVDSTLYDTTSILATLEKRFNLKPLAYRDAASRNLFEAFTNARSIH